MSLDGGDADGPRVDVKTVTQRSSNADGPSGSFSDPTFSAYVIATIRSSITKS
jgi:hypothetical protein